MTEIRGVADPALPIEEAGDRMTFALGRYDDRRPIMISDVVESKWNTMARQNMPDCDAEGGPRKLDEDEHGGLYDGSEAKPQAPMHASAAAGVHGERYQRDRLDHRNPPAIRIRYRILRRFHDSRMVQLSARK